MLLKIKLFGGNVMFCNACSITLSRLFSGGEKHMGVSPFHKNIFMKCSEKYWKIISISAAGLVKE